MNSTPQNGRIAATSPSGIHLCGALTYSPQPNELTRLGSWEVHTSHVELGESEFNWIHVRTLIENALDPMPRLLAEPRRGETDALNNYMYAAAWQGSDDTPPVHSWEPRQYM